MRAYRQAFRIRGRAGRLSQTGLLDLMGQVDEKYSELHGHSTVARWESGTTNPSRDRIEVFGKVLNLSHAEVEGLMRLAGLELNDAYPIDQKQPLAESVKWPSRSNPLPAYQTVQPNMTALNRLRT